MNELSAFLTPAEVAELLHVSPITVRSWANKGLLSAEITPGGHRRFPRQEVERFRRQFALEASPKSDSLKILIVDDDDYFRGFLLELMEAQSRSIVCDIATNGFEVGSKIHTFQPDIVLLDVMMPGLSGFEVSRQIKQDPATQHIRIIAITGAPNLENRQKLVDMGVECSFGKPLNTEAFFAVLFKNC